jgi:hypothetical protein
MDYYQEQPKKIKFGGFVMTFIIMDLVFSCLRIPMVALSIFGYTEIEPTDPIYQTTLFEIMTGLGIILFGILANILILVKKRIGCSLAWGNVLVTISSIMVGLWQASIVFGSSDIDEGPEKVGVILGGSCAIIIRVGILVCYIIAVLKAQKCLSKIADPYQYTLQNSPDNVPDYDNADWNDTNFDPNKNGQEHL